MSISRRDLLKTTVAVGSLYGVSAASPAQTRIRPQKSGWAPRTFAKKPNIVIAVLDDVGFGDLGCYGSEISTPCIDELAANGVRFNNFHVTALCAPTRASLLTGRNAHAVGVGNIAEWGRDLPGYKGYIRRDVRMLPEILGGAGYSAIAVGKWHLSMVHDQDAMGPFDYWPTHRGFDHWYGFHGSAVDHWHPELFRNASQVYPKKSDEYHLTADLVDQSIHYIADHLVSAPDRPFFLYLAFGACHFPFHAPKEFIQKYHGKYDAGWDVLRPVRFEKQKQEGVAPEGAALSPRGSGVPAWEKLSADERRFSSRTQEAFAGMLDHADAQFRRLVEFLRQQNELDNTIIVVMSDNGAAKSRHRAGVLDVRRVAYINEENVADLISQIDKIGSEQSSAMYAAGWGQVGNTPLKHHKGDTYEGGIRAPLIIHWPKGEFSRGIINGQYHHVSDLAPTLLEMINEPVSQDNDKGDGALDGVSLAYSLDAPLAKTTKAIQHYETAGDRAIWVDGWKAVTMHKKGDPFEADEWALFHADLDFAEIDNVADQHPQRLQRMVDLWRKEAEKNHVLPLDDDLDGLYAKIAPKPRPIYVFYPGATRLNRLSAPDIQTYDFVISAYVDLKDARANGVLLASGDSMAGYELIMRRGTLEFTYIYTREIRYDMKAQKRVGAGRHIVGLRGRRERDQGKTLELFIDDRAVDTLFLPHMWEIQALNAGVRCGQNRGAPISFSYLGAFEFGQTLEKVVVSLDLKQ